MQGAEAFQANMSTRRRVSLTPPALAEYISNTVQKETGKHHLQRGDTLGESDSSERLALINSSEEMEQARDKYKCNF